MKKMVLSVSLLAGILSTSTALAAEKMPLPRDMAFAASNGSSLRLSQGNELALVKTVKLKNQLTKTKFQQTYHGIPVYGYTSVADKRAGGYSNWHGFVLNKIGDDLKTTSTQLTKHDALEKLKASIPEAEQGTLYNQQVKLFVLLNSNRKATLVYLTSMVNDKEEPTRPTAFIDANSGEILEHWDGLAHKKAAGVGGNEKGGKYYYGDDFPKMGHLLDAEVGHGINQLGAIGTFNKNGGAPVAGVAGSFLFPHNFSAGGIECDQRIAFDKGRHNHQAIVIDGA